MQIADIVRHYASDQRITDLLNDINSSKTKRFIITGLSGSSLAFVIQSIAFRTQRLVVVIVSDREEALHLTADMELLFDETDKSLYEKSVLYFPPSYKNPYNFYESDSTLCSLRTTVLHRLVQSTNFPSILVCCPQSFIEPVPSSSFIEKEHLQLQVGEPLNMEFVVELLETFGFVNTDYVFESGQFAVRGAILDVFSYSAQHPYRIEFSEDNVHRIRFFDPLTQHSFTEVKKAVIFPDVHREDMSRDASILDILPPDALHISIPLTDVELLIQQEFEKYFTYDNHHDAEERKSIVENFYDATSVVQGLRKYHVIENYSGFAISETNDFVYKFNIKPHPSFGRNFKLLFESILKWAQDDYNIAILYENEKNAERYRMIFDSLSFEHQEVLPEIYYIRNSLHSGFVDQDLRLCLLTEHQISERHHRYRFIEKSSQAEAITLRDLKNIQPGDYVIHVDYGIGRYAGLEKILVQGREQEAVRIIYRNNDELLVSIHSLHKITKYVGKDGMVPQLDKLGGTTWLKRKYEAKKKVKDIARDLIRLYALRKASEGFAFLPDCSLQHELEASFIYEDTEDQARATLEVKADMEAPYPMDRLICGDVGFGKTEVAIRAAFKAALSGKQTAVLVPTTILAFQHYHTFSERLRNFPVRVEYVSRFRTPAEIRNILKDLKSGKIDIIIGTHRLLGKDVEFKDLGLLIIDEEQKFGVAAKEQLRKLKVNVDTLVLTATPIPRTLQFSLLGARDMSIIQTPPPNRLPVHTELITFHLPRIRDIIMYEINRGGQVFFINNRVQNIYQIAEKLREMCPDVRIDVGHGQMKGSELENKILNFMMGMTDVFVCTTIIESGIDIPNANTIIINDAHHFGLSDLYQLRGRVGRSNRKAYCYLIAPPLVLLTEQSRRRLKAIVEFSDLGSGLQLALRDLDIRGAGDLLGAEQSGFIAEIGYEMFNKILEEALEELKAEEQIEHVSAKEVSHFVKDCVLETDLSLLIPDWYVPQITERMALYRELSNIQTSEQLQSFMMHLEDRFGKIPSQVEELIKTIELRRIARQCGIEKIQLKQSNMYLHFYPFQDEQMQQIPVFQNVLNFVFQHPRRAVMKQENNRVYIVVQQVNSVQNALEVIKEIMNIEVL